MSYSTVLSLPFYFYQPVSVSLSNSFIFAYTNIHNVDATLGTWQNAIVREGSITKVTFPWETLATKKNKNGKLTCTESIYLHLKRGFKFRCLTRHQNYLTYRFIFSSTIVFYLALSAWLFFWITLKRMRIRLVITILIHCCIPICDLKVGQ